MTRQRKTSTSTSSRHTLLRRQSSLQEEKGGFIKTMWCGELECEMKMKEQAGMSSRCIPFEQENLGDTCPICGRKAKHMIVLGRCILNHIIIDSHGEDTAAAVFISLHHLIFSPFKTALTSLSPS